MFDSSRVHVTGNSPKRLTMANCELCQNHYSPKARGMESDIMSECKSSAFKLLESLVNRLMSATHEGSIQENGVILRMNLVAEVGLGYNTVLDTDRLERLLRFQGIVRVKAGLERGMSVLGAMVHK